MRRVAYWKVQRGMHELSQERLRRWLLEASYGKICEDYLGVPLIQAGDSVIIKMRGLKTRCNNSVAGGVFRQAGWNREERYSSLAVQKSTARDFFARVMSQAKILVFSSGEYRDIE